MDKQDSYLSFLLSQGWVRAGVSDEVLYFQVLEPTSANWALMDQFLAKHYKADSQVPVMLETNSKDLITNNPFPSLQGATWKQVKRAALDISQETQNAIASQYGPEMLVALRFYNEAVGYGQPPDRALEYAVSEAKNTGKPVDAETLSQVLKISF